jgi:gliding motility-associated-like protein
MKTLPTLLNSVTVKHTVLTLTTLFTILPLLINAQTISKPEPLFSYACPQATFNEFEVAFQIDPTEFAADNVFFVELSDADGEFKSPEILDVVENTADDAFLYGGFAFPESVYGESYKIRVRSSAPEIISAASDAFEAHYVANLYLSLNGYEDVSLCGSDASTTISLNSNNSLTYYWYKDGAFFQESTASLVVSEPGLYYAETFLGACTGLAYSNVVAVTQDNTAQAVSVAPSTEVSLSKGESQLFTAEGFDTFKWTNGLGETISTEKSVVIDTPGTYTMTTTNGSCEASKEIVVTETNDTVVTTDPINEVVPTYTDAASAAKAIPSFVSPNGDTINDTWVIPTEYANDPTVKVSIYTASGALVLDTNNYQNNWPQAEVGATTNVNSVVYYLISKEGRSVKKGSITLVQ